MFNLRQLTIDPADIVAIGITNQRETTVVWDSVTGQPLYNAIGKIASYYKRHIDVASYSNYIYLLTFHTFYTVDNTKQQYYYGQ